LALIVTAVTVLLAAALFPTAMMWADGFDLPDLAALGSQAALAASAGLLAATREHRRAAVLLGLGVAAVGLSNLSSATFETWGYASMVGYALQWLPIGFILPVLLTFPGRTLDRLGRILVGAVWIGAILWRIVVVPTWDPAWGGYDGPAPWLTYPGLESRELSDALLRVEAFTLGVLGLVSVVAFVRRWRSAHGLARVPVRVVSAAGIGLSVAVPLSGVRGVTSEGLSNAAWVAQNILLLLMPLGLLAVAGWSVMHRGSLVERLTARAGDARGVQDVLAVELGDPELRVYFRQPTSWLDVAGAEVPASLGRQGSPPYAAGLGRHWEFLSRGSGDGQDEAVVGAIDLADDALTDPGRVRVALRAAALVLDNSRLAVEREVHLAELTASQSRIVEAGLEERRRLERDLHDGAQQQLLAVSTTLSRARLLSDPERVRTAVDEARDQLSTALSELRRLAHGIHPGVLSQGGLVAGLEPLVRVDPRIRLNLDDALRNGARLEPDVETAAYFVATEGLANAVKHSDATTITVAARQESDPAGLRVVVSDDGLGGAAPSGGGLRGLRDRVSALGGTLELDSPPGEGTHVSVWLPA
jgi:signal transduction histidine kinase